LAITNPPCTAVSLR